MRSFTSERYMNCARPMHTPRKRSCLQTRRCPRSALRGQTRRRDSLARLLLDLVRDGLRERLQVFNSRSVTRWYSARKETCADDEGGELRAGHLRVSERPGRGGGGGEVGLVAVP